MSKPEMAFSILSSSHLLVPLVVVYFKSSKDIFMSFSKLQALGQVSGFQVIITNVEETSVDDYLMTISEVKVLLKKQMLFSQGTSPV